MLRAGHEQTILAFVLLVHLALSLVFVGATPVLEAPDEARHFGFIVDWRRSGGLPTATAADPGYAAQEAFQPFLYYGLGRLVTADIPLEDAARFYRWRPGSPVGRADLPGPRNMLEPVPVESSPPNLGHGVVRVRRLSVGLTFVTVVLTWLCARAAGASLVPRLFATSLVAFNPMLLFIGSSANNDVLVTTLTAGGLLACLSAVDRPLGPGRALVLGALAGLATLAKLSGLILLPVIAVLLLIRWRRGDPVVGPAMMAASGFVVVAGGWFVWLYRHYGVLLPGALQAELVGNARASIQPLALIREWEGFFKSFWGVFGAFNIIYSDRVYWLMLAATLVLMGSAGVLLVRRRRDPRLWMMAILVGANLLAVAWWTSSLAASQGRLMFPSIAAIATLAGMALAEWPSRLASAFALVVVLGLIVASTWAGIVLIPDSYL